MPDFYYFFLSYARDDDHELVERFFADLSVEVRGLAGLKPRHKVGYLDVHVPVGTLWPDTLTRALTGSANFVALISPRYLRSEACGREWAVFSERVRKLSRHPDAAPSAMMPIIWIPTDDLPQEVSDWQYTDIHFPLGYDEVGLRQMLRLQRFEQDYLEMLPKLARQIVTNARAHSVPAGDEKLNFHALRSAFAAEPSQLPQTGASLRDVNFIIVAPTREQAAQVAFISRGSPVTRELQFYGSGALDWAPFQPALGAPIAEYASQVADEQHFRAVVTDLNGAVELLRKARDEANAACSVLIVDPWTTHIEECRQALETLRASGGDAPIAAVLVPAGYEDHTTRLHIDELASALRSILLNGAWRQLTYRPDVLSADAFGADLQVVLEGCRSRAITQASRNRRPRRPSNRPILNGP